MTTDGKIQDRGFEQIASNHSVAETIERLESQLKEHNITIFARLDFAADAARVGLNMRAERMLIFGNPKAGTPLMQAVPAHASCLRQQVRERSQAPNEWRQFCSVPSYSLPA